MEKETIFRITGDLVFSTIRRTREAGARYISSNDDPCFDFSQTEKIDSSAVVLLLAWQRDAKKSQKPIHFQNIPQSLSDLADTYGLKSIDENR